MPINYQNGKIYKIINENNEIIYIGSTAQLLLCDRYKNHKYKAPNNKIILIENYSCNSKEELCMREQQIIEQHSNLLNKLKAYRSEEDKKKQQHKSFKKYYENNKEILNEKKKQYYQENKDEIIEKHKEYYELNKEELNKKRKEYCEKNKEILSKKSKQYYQENKNEISEKRKQKVNCEYCNFEIAKSQLKRHQKTQKCIKIQNEYF